MKPSVYIETTIPSYLTAWRNPSLLMAAHQEATRNWWDTARFDYDLFISEFVMAECASGNADAAERRLAAIQNLPELDISTEVEPLAQRLLAGAALPEKAKLDALHIAVATIHGIDYLLTWNCKHIANAITRPKIEWICRAAGYEPPVICTPLELMRD
ncbi:type II toxin-antitoxin system VapC family toxin [Thiothrix subterranea]|jgi:Predicted nucleic acid-binding protein, contains PIN domain|uniref:Type II toxin-antitoxin system VapC family toxin n=1 Tax=Thiothrix subterranea TaxID=2735563 RepID=A0AA51MJT7_9GAMM|nr:type II toxin-antitoxin system VapC family toxin [Thiothrix subterranea]MDQ5770983.1 type II toxin-antitoxin system VapC family toxin [Thiothrix subterranea]WML85273.1 type II toxin-antitoxin system VapC family toxin [Thiothrix subterranea]